MYSMMMTDNSNFTNTDDGAMSNYQDYPANKPFINCAYRRDPLKPNKAYPETNRPAVMAALKNLQDRIRQLELERAEAEANMKDLSLRASSYKDSLRGSSPLRERSPGRRHVTMQLHENDFHEVSENNSFSHGHRDVNDQLLSAENRCGLLEKQLDYMRQMVSASEKDRTDALRRAAELQQHRDDMEAEEIKSQFEKINELEREHLKLTATQTLAESKIRELEEKLKEEKHHRKLMQTRAAEAESSAETNGILQKANINNISKKNKKKKIVSSKSKAPPLQRKRGQTVPASRNISEHYRLNLAEIPFVAGTSTTPSHSVPANVQNVLSMMKCHNEKLCGGSLSKNLGSHTPKDKFSYTSSGYYSSTRGGSGSSSSNSEGREESELGELLLQLQDEFGQLSFEHQEIMQQIHETVDSRTRADLERELDVLIARMEAKGDQIAKLRRHAEKTEETKRKKKKKRANKVANKHPHRPGASLRTGDEVAVTTTITNKGSRTQVQNQMCKNRPQSGSALNKVGNTLGLLKDLKKIQTSLGKDDLSWDC